jgi:hypothetical protein
MQAFREWATPKIIVAYKYVVALVVAFVVTRAANLGVTIPESMRTTVEVMLVGAAGAVANVALNGVAAIVQRTGRWLETHRPRTARFLQGLTAAVWPLPNYH